MIFSFRKLFLVAAGLLLTATALQAKDIDLSTDKAQLGYTYGAQIGQELVNSGLIKDVDLAVVLAAITDITSGKESKLSAEQQQAAQEKYQEKQMAVYEALASTNKAKSEAYMIENAKKSGVKTTESGLQYEVIREGKGSSTTDSSIVKVHYVGKKVDGEVFDSSYDRGSPASFSAGAVIPGFSEGLKLMKEGGKIRLHIPDTMAYGMNAPESIGPNQALIFEVELIEVNEPGVEAKTPDE
jgi:FKBP-type peptidyl-prolyl cis-trans isomerase